MQFSSSLPELFENAPSMAAITTGPDHRIQYANATLREAFGARDYLNRPAADMVVSPSERREIRAYLDSVYRNGSQLIRRAVAFTLNGLPAEPTYYDAMYHPLFDDEKCVIGVFVEGHDVTARVRMEASQSAVATQSVGLPDLTDRQREVLAGIMTGLGTKQIAHRLGISDRTAEMHRHALLRRLGMRTTAQLVSALATRPELATLAEVDAGLSGRGKGDDTEAKSATAQRLATEVEQVQRDLKRELKTLAALAVEQPPDRTKFIEVRYALTQASLHRREILRRANAFLRRFADEEEQPILHRVELSDDSLLSRSVAHASRWKTEITLKKWPAYVEASLQLRHAISAQMDLERTLLMPLLEKHAHAGASD